MDGYVRVSQVRGREGDSFISPAVQRQQIERWAAMRDVAIDEWHIDLDRSGVGLDRPGMDAALARIESGESNGLVVAKLDRFARSLPGALDAIRRIDDAGASFVSVAEGIDPTTPAGKLQQNIMLVFAEFELDRIREGWATAQERAVARGIHIASRVPTGYIKGEDGRLEPHPEYGPAITEAFHKRAAGASWRELASYLNENGVVGPYGINVWRTRAVQHIIANRAYLGEARSGRFVNPDAHPPLIDRPTWEGAQQARGASWARSKNPALLAGLLRCAGCRYVLKPDWMTAHGKEKLRIYRCRGEHAAGTCGDRAAVLARVIEPLVEERFFDVVGDLAARANDGREFADAERAASSAEAELAHYRDDERIATALGRDRYVEGLEARVQAVNDAHRRLSEARQQASVGQIAHVGLRELWPELTVPEKQKLLIAVFDAIFLRSGRTLAVSDRALFLARGEAPGDLPSRGRRVPLAPFPWPDDGPGTVGVTGAQDLDESALDG